MSDEKSTISIGLIGMGEMGRMYAERIAQGGWKR
jgi:3-hydroxyisobutyrate dehydrogenase-like beta-hydroxyacid dehydrogenase